MVITYAPNAFADLAAQPPSSRPGGGYRSSAQDVDGPLQHGARGLDHLQVGLVAALRLAHVGHFDERVYVRYQDIPGPIGRGMARLVPAVERPAIIHDPGHLNGFDAKFPIE